MREGDFSLPPKERAVYGATVTARSLTTGETLTIARTNMTAVEAVREVATVLDALDDDYRVVAISTPNSIERDMWASRILLDSNGVGQLAGLPEQAFLTKIKRPDLLHPSLNRMTERATHVKHRER